ncbi:hypothetical protein LY90DRAFT_511598 [Neocallimastix californiae]|uniref:Uncharacterized protein n=1 Tax=Neocallimastix californiae TaxID=1754190 RepID=A0A1Y2BNF9_9FUNG|nr:hypothetical protein LY90DRAFT_511598 [Neocallimastix californiae]|eukprot:ORY36252.1 hypothetical protein LY90DRAFT_511598 [Neocallimastix californiae]
MILESSYTTKKVISNTHHKLRRTKKSENLREEWKKYHNNFIPVIPSNSSNTKENVSIISTGIIENINLQQSPYNYTGIKYSIKNNIDKNNYIKLADELESKIKEQHITKKSRLFSFIPL